MKECFICKKEFTGIKYCSNKCAYQAIKNRVINKKMNTQQQENTMLISNKLHPIPQKYVLHYMVAKELFNVCPFCGCDVNVFTVPETRYGESNNFSWNLECKNMGCIFKQPDNGFQLFKDLMNAWNKRYSN
jgi:hypothetical protein